MFNNFIVGIFLLLLLFSCSEYEEKKNTAKIPVVDKVDISTVDTNKAKLVAIYYNNGNEIKFYGSLIETIPHQYCKWFYINGQLKSQGKYNIGRKEGWWEYFYKNGIIKSKGFYRKNMKDDILILTRINSLECEKGSYCGGKKKGLWIYYNSLGDKKREINYKDGKQEGLYKLYQNDTTLIEKGSYIGGKRDGWIQFFNNDGNLREECSYLRGVRNGGYKLYIENYLFYEGTYLNNKKVGVWKEYNSEGKIISEIDED